jgi:putative chitinase
VNLAPEQLRLILPQAGSRAYVFCGPLNSAMAEVGIDTPHEVASFVAEVGHESRHLQALAENLNYSDKGLLATWPRRFDPVTAARYARHPEMIANRAYAHRYGNGDEASGDGWRYRGRGAIQITFHDNYAACGAALGLDLLRQPELLLDPINAMRSAGWFWKVKGLDAEDDDDDVTRETRIINGGALGLAERQAIFDRALKELS